jgi:hypothetical protein
MIVSVEPDRGGLEPSAALDPDQRKGENASCGALAVLLAAPFPRYHFHNEFVADRLLTSPITNAVVPLMCSTGVEA